MSCKKPFQTTKQFFATELHVKLGKKEVNSYIYHISSKKRRACHLFFWIYLFSFGNIMFMLALFCLNSYVIFFFFLKLNFYLNAVK